MAIVRLTPDNLDSEHICCAIADKKCAEGYQRKKGQGHGRRLLEECLEDAAGMNGVAVVVGDKKRPFLADKASSKSTVSRSAIRRRHISS